MSYKNTLTAVSGVLDFLKTKVPACSDMVEGLLRALQSSQVTIACVCGQVTVACGCGQVTIACGCGQVTIAWSHDWHQMPPPPRVRSYSVGVVSYSKAHNVWGHGDVICSLCADMLTG